MTFLVVGLDRHTLSPWHGNVRAADAAAARGVALARAHARGIALAIAAVIGPNDTVMAAPAGA